MIKSVFIFLFGFMVIHSSDLGAQITLNNASFEEEPADATTPMGWFECTESTTPDILPGFWGVYNEASEGDTYVGIITRGNGTFESIGQRVSTFFEATNCYEFTVDLAKSDTYVGYYKPIRLRIWIGDRKCSRDQLIFESPLIEQENWNTYPIQFIPEKDCNYIFFEAYHSYNRFSYMGNILIDNVSEIILCSKT